eukprot:6214072-Pleurochrysis_carterae.AAC.3
MFLERGVVGVVVGRLRGLGRWSRSGAGRVGRVIGRAGGTGGQLISSLPGLRPCEWGSVVRAEFNAILPASAFAITMFRSGG